MFTKLESADRNRLAVSAVVLSIIFLLAINIFASNVFTSARLDLTQDQLFSLTDDTRQVISKIDEPIELRFYLSSQLLDSGPALAGHAKRVRELLDEYVRLADGKIHLKVYNPQPFSPEEDMAVADGARGVPVSQAGELGYFGVVGVNSTDDRDGISFLSPERARFLEYDLTKLVHNLATPEKPVVAIIGRVPFQGHQSNQFTPLAVMETMRQSFEVRLISGSPEKIDDDVVIVILGQANETNEKTIYAIDQFVMRGGRILAFVDPMPETIPARNPKQPDPTQPPMMELEPLMTAWGVEVKSNVALGDRLAAQPVSAGQGGRQMTTDYLPWLSLSRDAFQEDDVVMAELTRINMMSAGIIQPLEGASTTLVPMIRSSPQSMELALRDLRFPDPPKLLADFQPSGERYIIAARVTGPVKTAYPNGPPRSVVDEEVRNVHKEEADKPLNMIILSDADILADRTWMQVQRVYGQSVAMPISNNGDFVVNSLDSLAGAGTVSGLAGLRGRGLHYRPFEVLRDMEREAETRFRARERELAQKLEETEQKILSIERTEGEGGAVLTEETEEAVDNYRAELIQTRKDLREVQRALREDVESLKARIKAVNLWAVPLAVAVIAIVLAVIRRARAARYRRAEA